MPDNDAVDTAKLDEVQAELERTREALKKANAESAERRKKLEGYEAKDKDALTETQRLQQELETERKIRGEHESRLRTLQIERAVEKKAAELLFEHPEDAVRFIDLSKVVIAEDGKISGYEKALEELAKSGRLPVKGATAPRLGTPLMPGSTSTQKPNVDDMPVSIRL